MGRPKKVRTPEEEAAYKEKRRTAKREAMRRRRADPERRAEAAAAKRRRRVEDPEFQTRERESRRLNARRRRERDPGLRLLENFQRQARRDNILLGEALPAADGVKARRARVHRTTERRWSLVTCPHHSTSAAGTLRVATADFSAVFPDIDFKQAVEAACDKAPFIEASLASSTCRVEPWRGLQDKCVGEHEALLQHAEQSCQTEHHITLVRCTKPQVSTCSVEVQADPWWQHHCGIQPIGVDLCET
ncbi:uncharacterized protein LOC142589973 isoform X8 [Dermacentor variabilis]|uniref:uncharacterized protein LOC142589973 isoform X8 n=1 Tax=Dermacentor variabilis TaxID=34621 RepID=UPI003F5BDDCB